MSRTLRRGLSWVLTLASLAALAAGITRLPGAGSTLEELRWLLGGAGVPSRDLNRAAWLIRMAYEQSPQMAGCLMEALLFTPDDRVVHGALTILTTWPPEPDSTLPKDLCTAYSKWFRCVSVAEKVRHLPQSLACFALINATHFDTRRNAIVFSLPEWNATDPRWPLPAQMEDTRWLIAGTVCRDVAARADADMFVFRSCGPYMTIDRLHSLDGVDSILLAGPLPRPIDRHLVHAGLEDQLWIAVDDLLAMLSDPIDQVRWGAGRILAVAGDERGLPAFCDWLQHNPRFTANANKLMTDLFGPDWRTHCASGSPTSQPGQRDGGG